MRRSEGISDVELRQAIRKLVIGDCVKVTLLTSPKSFQTLLVRITSIRGSAFHGELAHRPAAPGPTKVPAGTSIAFTTAHIHSVEREPLLKKLTNGVVAVRPSKPTSGRAKPRPRTRVAVASLPVPISPLTTTERVRCIEALGLRVNALVQFMCRAGNPNRASGEATDRAVGAFYDQMVLFESRLDHIQSEFKAE